MKYLALMMSLTAVLSALPAFAAVIDFRAAAGVPVAETDLLAVLEARVREAADAGLFRAKNREAESRFDRLARRPVALGLTKADAPRTWSKVLVTAETLRNVGDGAQALKTLRRTYAFIDADEVSERRWVKALVAEEPGVRIVAVAGDLILAQDRRTRESLAGLRLFADQGGSLVRRFGLIAHPACVTLRTTAAGIVMTGEEIPLTDDEP